MVRISSRRALSCFSVSCSRIRASCACNSPKLNLRNPKSEEKRWDTRKLPGPEPCSLAKMFRGEKSINPRQVVSDTEHSVPNLTVNSVNYKDHPVNALQENNHWIKYESYQILCVGKMQRRMEHKVTNLTFMWPCIVINLITKPTIYTNFLKFILEMKLYMFRTVPLSIIRSFSLYTQQWYMSYRFAADSCGAGSGRSVLILLHSCLQQTCMTYTTAVCTVKNSWW